MAQLVAGCLLASAMLALTALLRPYKHLGDDILAIGCQAAVVANLALAILLRSRRAESDLRRLAFTTDTAADAAYAEAVELDLWEESIAHGLIAAAVTPIVGAVVLAVVQLRPIRRAPSRSKYRHSRRAWDYVRVVGAGGLVWSKPLPARRPAAAASMSALQQEPSAEGGAREAAVAPPRPLRLPPPAASGPPAIERWKSGLAARAISRLEMEATARARVERARASMTDSRR